MEPEHTQEDAALSLRNIIAVPKVDASLVVASPMSGLIKDPAMRHYFQMTKDETILALYNVRTEETIASPARMKKTLHDFILACHEIRQKQELPDGLYPPFEMACLMLGTFQYLDDPRMKKEELASK